MEHARQAKHGGIRAASIIPSSGMEAEWPRLQARFTTARPDCQSIYVLPDDENDSLVPKWLALGEGGEFQAHFGATIDHGFHDLETMAQE